MNDDKVTITYYGTDVFTITTAQGMKILIDPYITESSAYQEKLEKFFDIDLLLITHGARDHIGDAVKIMRSSQALMVCGADIKQYCEQMGLPPDRIRLTVYGDEKEIQGVRIKTVAASHASKISSEKETFYGVAMGYIITTENGIRIYHAGDTAIFSDLRLFGALYHPHIFLVGISRSIPGEHACYEMSPTEAALATLWVSPDIAIPMHYLPGSEAPQQFADAVRIVAPGVEPILLPPGQQITYRKYQFSIGAKGVA